MGKYTDKTTYTTAASAGCSQAMHTILKQGTADLHRRLDALPNVRAFMNPTLDKTQYCLSLKAYTRAYIHIEPKLVKLEKLLNLGDLSNYIPRLPSLIHDLKCLAEDVPQHLYISSISLLIEDFGMPHYIGLRYVLEGSTQGSKIIAQRLKESLPDLSTQAFSFWDVQLQAFGQWPVFCKYISQSAGSSEFEQQMLKASQIAFQYFIECFRDFEETR